MNLVTEFANSRNVTVIAPAGCGKTQLIAEAVATHNTGNELILTHTHAGIFALRNRLQQLGANPKKYIVETIAGWALKYVLAYPALSKVQNFTPSISDNWEDVYTGMFELQKNGELQKILKESYSGIYVDEYQDCLKSQHEIIKGLAKILPCRIVGDPLQSIFGFGNNQLADWKSEVIPTFPVLSEMDIPWRWKTKNPELGEWLQDVRKKIILSESISLVKLPKTIQWIPSSNKNEVRHTYFSFGKNKDQTCCIITEWEKQCHSLARATGGFFNSIETMECKDLLHWISKIMSTSGLERAKQICEFAGECFSGVKTPLTNMEKKLNSSHETRGSLKFVVATLKQITTDDSIEAILAALEQIKNLGSAKLFRYELYFEMCRTLKEHNQGDNRSLQECALVVRERTKHNGRPMAQRIASRTLLVKGLEFDHCMIIEADKLNKNNLYVALTRGSRTLHIVSSEPILKPIKNVSLL
jgi:hypothetical protein